MLPYIDWCLRIQESKKKKKRIQESSTGAFLGEHYMRVPRAKLESKNHYMPVLAVGFLCPVLPWVYQNWMYQSCWM